MSVRILIGDCRQMLKGLESESAHCIVTSPPYFGLRDYRVAEQIGLETTPDAYVKELVDVFRECRRILKNNGTLWLNLGDSYANDGKWGGHTGGKHVKALHCSPIGRNKLYTGLKPKDLIGIPWLSAFAIRNDGWFLRSAIIWAKPNGMPGSQKDRCSSSYETVFYFSKTARYWSDFDAIKTPPRESTLIRTAQDIQAQAGSHRAHGGAKTNSPMKAVGGLTERRDKQRGHSRQHAGFNDRWDAMEKSQQQASPAMMRDVWFISPSSYAEAHFAVMPDELARRCILAGCPLGGVVLDPFGGAGTTGLVADRLQRNAILIELNSNYAKDTQERIIADAGILNTGVQIERAA